MPRRHPLALVPAALLLASMTACGLRARLLPAASDKLGVETHVFCGRAKANGGVVSNAEWQTFLTDVVTPHFPRGFTVIDAGGFYSDDAAHELAQERTEILVIVHDGSATANAAIAEIVTAYRERFDQRAVLRVDTRAAASFR